MTKYVALIRGIMPSNPNMRSEKLRSVFEALGFENVKSVISSGNIIFETNSSDTKKLESKIESALPNELGFHNTTIVRSQSELQRISDSKPFSSTPDVPTSQLNVTFLKKADNVMSSIPYKSPNNTYRAFKIDNKTIGTVTDTTSAKTPDVMRWLEKEFSSDITTRTWKTVHRILKKME